MSDLTPWERLHAAQLVEGDAPRDEQPHWSGRFLLGMVGWIAALFLLFFLGHGQWCYPLAGDHHSATEAG